MMRPLVLISLLGLILVPSAVALQPPPGTPSATPSSIRDSVKQKVDEELNQIKQAVSKKAYAGSISAKTDGQISITTFTSQTRSALVTTDASIKLAGSKDGTPADLKVGDFVLAMGDADGQGLLTVKRLLVIPQPQANNRTTLFATVTKTATGSLTTQTPDNKTYTVKLQSATKYSGKTKPTDITTGSKVVLIGTSTSDTALTARLIHLLP